MKVNFGLKPEEIQDLAKELTRALANTYGLYVNTLNCHWNLEDPRFLFLHEMFQSQYEQLAKNGDEIAERLRKMGIKIPGSLQFFASQSEFEPISENASANEMMEELATSHEKIFVDLRKLSKKSDQYGDYGLTDLLGSLIRDHEKTAWFIRSHL